jgi:hypothetical protein
MAKPSKMVIHFAKTRPSKAFPPKQYPWTIHYKGQCIPIKKLRLIGYMESEWHPLKPNNPRAFFTCYGTMRVINGFAVVRSMKMPARLRREHLEVEDV